MLRLLLAIAVAAVFGLAGCQKKEPTIGDKIDQAAQEVKQEAEKTADQATDAAKEVVDEAAKTAEEAAK
jgi:outer membrane murein-binding lipoprotein Lpp